MTDLDDLARAAGLDPDSPDYRLRQALTEADSRLLESLVRLRRAKGLTQKLVADRIGRDKSAISNFEKLSADPHQSTIRRYAAAVGAYITHAVQDVDAIAPREYHSVLEARLDEVLNDWHTYLWCSTQDQLEDANFSEKEWGGDDEDDLEFGNVVFFDFSSASVLTEAPESCVACDG